MPKDYQICWYWPTGRKRRKAKKKKGFSVRNSVQTFKQFSIPTGWKGWLA